MTSKSKADLQTGKDYLRRRIVELEAGMSGPSREKTVQASSPTAPHAMGASYQAVVEQIGGIEGERDSPSRQLCSLMKGLAAAGLGVHIVSADYKIVLQNDLLTECCGDATGASCYASLAGFEEPCDWCPMKAALASGGRERAEIRGTDGRDYEIIMAPISTVAGPSDRAIEIVMDITARKRVEDQRNAEYQQLQASEMQLRASHQRLEASNRQLKAAEGKVQESERLFRCAADEMPGLICRFMPDGRVTYVNKACCDFFSRHSEELVGSPFEALLPEQDRAATMASIRALHPASPVKISEHRVMSGDGADRWQRWTHRGLFDEKGRPQAYESLCEDVTALKQAEEVEKSQFNFLNAVMDQSPFSMWISDKNGTLIRTNRALRNALNLTDEQILGKYNVLEDENLNEQGVMHLVRDVFFEQRPARFVIQWETKKVGNVDFAKGKDLWIEVSMFPVLDARGNLAHAVCQWIDISERKETEEKLRRSDLIVAESTDMLALLDTSYTYLHANQNYADAFGMSKEQLVGRTVEEVLGEDFFARVIRPHAERCMAGEGVRYEDWFHFPATGHRYMQITYASYIGANGEVAGFVVNKRDITDEKLAKDALRQHQENLERVIQERTSALRLRTAELEATNRELESFAYSVSHDLRAPLRAIDGFSKAFMEDYGDGVSGAGRDQLNRVRAAAQRMGMLIDALLQLSRLSRVEARSVDVDLSAMARAIVAQLRFNESARAVDVSIAPGLVAPGDPTLLESALDNLLSNAWKFTSEKEDARIEMGELVIDGERTIFVRDNGAGFDMAYADKLFGVFQRLHDATEFSGTGVGLATVHRVVRRHGGRVWAEGAVDHGATFYFTLPGQAP